MTKWLIKIAQSGSAILVADQGIVSAGNFATTVLIAKALSAAHFGSYSLLNTTLLIVTGIANALVSESVRMFGVNLSSSRKNGYASAQFALRIATSFPVAIVAVVAGWIIASDEQLVAPAFAMLCVTTMFQELARAFGSAERRWRDVLITDVICFSVRIAGVAAMAAIDALTLPRVLVIMAAGSMAGALYRPLGTAQFYAPSAAQLGEFWQQNWRYGKWLAMESLVFTLSTQIYVFVVASRVGLSAVGGMSAAQSVVNLMNLVLIAATTSVSVNARFTLLSTGYFLWRRYLVRAGTLVVSVAAIASVALAAFATPLMTLLYTPDIAKYAQLVTILAAGAVLTIANSMLNVAFRTAEMPKIGLAAKIISAVVTNIVAIPLVWRFGVWGAAMGIVLTQVCWSLVFAYHIFKKGTLSETNVNRSIEPHVNAARIPGR